MLLADLRDLIVCHIERFAVDMIHMKISSSFLCEIRALKANESMHPVGIQLALANPDRLNPPICSEQLPYVLHSVCVREVLHEQIALLL